MDKAILDILDVLREGEANARDVDRIIRARSKELGDGRRVVCKKRLLPRYFQVRAEDGPLWRSWYVDPDLDARFVRAMQVKPRRTASGVATITVITKPWACSGSCLFCPNDVRMPKSYLHDEPACQRAERNFFDPYLQVASRLRALEQMGHATDKVELIVLGGTWTDYPRAYRLWFAAQLFNALNDGDEARAAMVERRIAQYESCGIANAPDDLEAVTADWQRAVAAGEASFNEAVEHLYVRAPSWRTAARWQISSVEDLVGQQRANETARHRVVGLVVETRPDALSPASLRELRQIGCTKVQMGIQSLDEGILALNGRPASPDAIAHAFELCRLFGFKTHAHFMVNLLGSTPESDERAYAQLVTDRRFLPDEVKLYPCALVAGTGLVDRYERGAWRPYSESELIEVLTADMRATPPFTRVSRMIRDISAGDILAGNKKGNLRQLVEGRLEPGEAIGEMRYREIATRQVAVGDLELDEIAYETPATDERFLQWVTPQGMLAGFLRLSLPKPSVVAGYGDLLPIRPGEAMIREVHVYGFAAELSQKGGSAQHRGLGRSLVERACELARAAGYARVNVISAVGTREYYRALGFVDEGLYQRRRL